MPHHLAAALCAVLFLAAPAAADSGRASWYGPESGNRTANGERFHPGGMTCAHRSLKFGTRVKVTDLATGRSIVCRINDRGPAKWTGKIIDLSRGAAGRLGILKRGVARVRIERVK